MRLASRDRTMLLSIAAPGQGFAVTLAGHLWVFTRAGEIAGSIPPREPENHLPVSRPERCPGCIEFIEKNHSTTNAGKP